MRIVIDLERSKPYDDLILLSGEIEDYVTLEVTKEKDSPFHEKKVSIVLSPYDVKRLQRALNALGE